ncbi:phosphoinositide 3-kinase regulatory subunit 4 [Viridothelium virens]|uniref:non-specific serine/threonine protein kinase n=1 Tax=Viridothelium virens TaxID=1048519 RepID=A0A6A6HL34_VIRVR|nr:phosphoinositide 3-kinase regulatory subunit 4 [Viridothelium virens]
MGQGYSLTSLSAGAAGLDVPEMSDLTYERALGNARFMKTVRARQKMGLVVVKIVMKPSASITLGKYIKTIKEERRLLSEVPNALGYQRIVETGTSGYLVRQYIHSSLYDRMSTRPFLEDIEKKWLSFQLLNAVRDCHARNIYHGDIKTENTLVTSWNWLYLTDFSSSFKPTYLPEDNPADFSFFFDTSARRTCYLAPERFLGHGQQAEGRDKINWAMDIFSVGCVIAELFLETPIFNLSQLFKYRRREYDPGQMLSKIEDIDIRDLVSHMIQVEPESRYSAEEYLTFWRHKAFPEYFYSFLHQYMYVVTDPTSGRAPITAGESNLGESDDRIDRVYYDFDKISYFLGYDRDKHSQNSSRKRSNETSGVFPLHLDLPNYRRQISAAPYQTVDDGTLVFLTLVVSSLRSTARASARVRACELLLAFAERLTDEAKLDRVLPHLVELMRDPVDAVKIAALRSVTQLLDIVTVASPVNVNVFPEYLMPRLSVFVQSRIEKPGPLVRATYAICLSSLAMTASRFLDMMQALRADGSLPNTDPETENDDYSSTLYQQSFDKSRADLVKQFEVHTKALLTDGDASVRRAFLSSVSPLCVFFGTTKANDVILSHLNTYLNDRDWMLKCAFFETIVGVATYVGSTNLEEFILPLMIQALTDPEEFVVERVLRSLAVMAHLGLFQRSRTWELIDIVGRFTMHPNLWIREATAHFISAATTYLSDADKHTIIGPLIRPYLKVPPTNLTELKLLETLKKSIPRIVFEMAVLWATKTEKGIFWKSAHHQGTFTFGSLEQTVPTTSARELTRTSFAKIPKNDEDEQWVSRLRNANMSTEDELKLVALRGYIWRTAMRKKATNGDSGSSKLNGIVPLSELTVPLQTVFFDDDRQIFEDVVKSGATTPSAKPQSHSLAEALLDASANMDDPIVRRKMSALNAHKASKPAASGTTSGIDKARDPPAIQSSSSGSPSGERRGSSQQAVVDTRRKSLGINLSPSPDTGTPENEPSSVASDGIAGPDEHRHAVRHKGSAVDLMQRGQSNNKANAEISTSSANAFGKVDGNYNKDGAYQSPLALAQDQSKRKPSAIRFQNAHTYDGNDPSILKLLDTLYLENYPVDAVEFGPIIQPLSRRQTIRRSNGQASATPWRPEGILVATFSEHTAPVTRVVVAPDHAFFLTGSDDGSVKVWDSARLERNIAHRSRQTHRHPPGTQISSLAFVENTHCFISTSTDGSVNVVKVDYIESNASSRYGKLRVLREWQLPDNEYATWSEHFKSENQSILILCTNLCRVVAIDLRTMSTLYEFANPVQHGTPNCFCLDKRHHWLLLGTSHGILDLWDLRFRLRVRGWGFAGASKIHRIVVHPVRSTRKKKVCIAGGTGQGEVTVWDLEKFVCQEVYRTAGSKETLRGFDVWKIEEEKPEGMLARFAVVGGGADPSVAAVDRGVRAIATGVHVPEDGSEPRHGFFVSAGPDWKVRFWDMDRVQASKVVSGLDVDEGQPTFEQSEVNQDTSMVFEKANSGGGRPSGPGRAGSSNRVPSNSSAKRTSSGSKGRTGIVSVQQQKLLHSHLDTVMDVALLEYPYGMIISVDRSGVIYVFQ